MKAVSFVSGALNFLAKLALVGMYVLAISACEKKESLIGVADAASKVALTSSTKVVPVNFGAVINTTLRQSEASFTADGKTMYFNCQTRPTDAGNEICLSHLTGTIANGQWSNPEVVAPGVISVDGLQDYEPEISPDGNTLVFQSYNRPGGYGESDIWVSKKVNGLWQEPTNLGPPFNSPYNDHCLSFSADGNEAFWTSDRPGGFGGNDIWTSKKVNGVWQPAVNMGPNINSKFSEHHSMPSPDGRSLYVVSDRPGGLGAEDIYVTSIDSNGEWSPLKNMGAPINSDTDDRCPSFTPDHQYFVFDSERAGGVGAKDLYWIPYDAIKDLR